MFDSSFLLSIPFDMTECERRYGVVVDIFYDPSLRSDNSVARRSCARQWKSVEHLRKAVRWELISYYTLVIICFTVRGHPLRHRLATSPSKSSVFSGAVHSAL